MSNHYPQFCALARAAEIIGERWTLLIIRELLLVPKRFVDLLYLGRPLPVSAGRRRRVRTGLGATRP
jgi:hypothetical protein